MPIDAMLVSAAVISMFLVFAGVLAWGEIQTRPVRLTAVQHSQKCRGNETALETTLLSISENPPENPIGTVKPPR